LALTPDLMLGKRELRSLSWLSQTNRVSYFRLSHMYKIFHGHAPPYLLDTFTRFYTVHSIGTRVNLLNFVLPNSSGKMASSFLYLGSKEWNGLTSDIKQSTSERIFKSKLRVLFT
jgi:hypothetical protein